MEFSEVLLVWEYWQNSNYQQKLICAIIYQLCIGRTTLSNNHKTLVIDNHKHPLALWVWWFSWMLDQLTLTGLVCGPILRRWVTAVTLVKLAWSLQVAWFRMGTDEMTGSCLGLPANSEVSSRHLLYTQSSPICGSFGVSGCVSKLWQYRKLCKQKTKIIHILCCIKYTYLGPAYLSSWH